MVIPSDIEEVRLPFYFGSAADQLFGCFHAPSHGARRDMGVLLCNPFGHEYLRAHRAFVQLAKGLVGRGLPVLRFDYYGTGDSAGEAHEGSLDRWVENIHVAIDELRDRSGVREVCLVGLRLGASLASMAATDRQEVTSLVLWDPVVQGAAHLDELKRAQMDLVRLGNLNFVRFEDVPKRNSIPGSGAAEVLGFSLPTRLYDEIRRLDLRTLHPSLTGRALIIESGKPAGVEELQALLSENARTEHRHLPDTMVWQVQSIDRAIVPNKMLNSIATWVAGDA